MNETLYERPKGLNSPKVKKTTDQKFLEPAQVKALLDEVKKENRPQRGRDHALIFLGFYLGLRCGEAPLLRRSHFKGLKHDTVCIPTLKQSPRIPAYCHRHGCHRHFRVAIDKIGKTMPCPRCGKRVEIEAPARMPEFMGPPELSPPTIEEHVKIYAADYVATLHDGEDPYLFPGRYDRPISSKQIRTIFNYYVPGAGLDPEISFHALRHGRGVQVYDINRSLKDVQDFLRQRNVQTAEIYVHMSSKSRAQYKEKLKLTALKEDVL